MPMVEYFGSGSDGAEGEPVYVRLSGTSSNEIWPKMLQRVKELFGDAVKG